MHRMKTASIICLALVAFPLFAGAVEGSVSQPGFGDRKEASLVGASATVSAGVLTVTGSTEGPTTQWNHVFLGTSGNQDTGYAHTSGKKGGQGMNYLVEGDFLYRWSGLGDRTEWKWSRIGTTKITRTTGINSFTVSLPVDDLHLRPGEKLQIFLVTSSQNYGAILDTLPRNDSLWQIEVHAAELNKSAGSDSSAVAAPSADARERFKKITSYACYYGKDGVDQLSRRDAVIIETRAQTAETIAAIKKKARWFLAILAPEKTPS